MTEKAIKTETKISATLFWICFFITLLTIFMSLAEFFSRGGFPPSRISIFYIGVLTIYALHKEALRFLDRSSTEKGQKRGETFVYVWIIITAILYLINFITKDHYSFADDGKQLMSLTHIGFLTLEVGAVFVLARIMKLLMIKYLEKNENQ